MNWRVSGEKRTWNAAMQSWRANIVFQKSYCWWHGFCAPGVHPLCLSSSCPPCLQLWWRHWVIEQCCRCCCRCVLPATAAVSAQINAWSVTVLCCNALDSSFLSLMHSLPLSALLPPCSLSFVHLHSVTREETQWEPRIQIGCLP